MHARVTSPQIRSADPFRAPHDFSLLDLLQIRTQPARNLKGKVRVVPVKNGKKKVAPVTVKAVSAKPSQKAMAKLETLKQENKALRDKVRATGWSVVVKNTALLDEDAGGPKADTTPCVLDCTRAMPKLAALSLPSPAVALPPLSPSSFFPPTSLAHTHTRIPAAREAQAQPGVLPTRAPDARSGRHRGRAGWRKGRHARRHARRSSPGRDERWHGRQGGCCEGRWTGRWAVTRRGGRHAHHNRERLGDPRARTWPRARRLLRGSLTPAGVCHESVEAVEGRRWHTGGAGNCAEAFGGNDGEEMEGNQGLSAGGGGVGGAEGGDRKGVDLRRAVCGEVGGCSDQWRRGEQQRRRAREGRRRGAQRRWKAEPHGGLDKTVPHRDGCR